MKYSFNFRICAILLLAPLLVLPACSTTKEIPEYKSSKLLPPLEIPPDLDKPDQNERMKIPDLPPVTGEGKTDADTKSDPRAIEKPPVFLEEDNPAN